MQLIDTEDIYINYLNWQVCFELDLIFTMVREQFYICCFFNKNNEKREKKSQCEIEYIYDNCICKLEACKCMLEKKKNRSMAGEITK